MRYTPEQVIPRELACVVRDLPYWFVIGGQAVRCFCPYRPTRDVDFGVGKITDFEALLVQLRANGETEIVEREPNTVHLRFRGIDVSVFLLDKLVPYAEDRCLNVEGILATKLHAILDRGMRRDFFDLYVTMQVHKKGLVECLSAIRAVYRQDVNDQLLLRALTYFDDAEREAPLSGESKRDWKAVKQFFQTRVGQLLIPPDKTLDIQACVVGVDIQMP